MPESFLDCSDVISILYEAGAREPAGLFGANQSFEKTEITI
jgi:hypothetical protein